MEYYVVNGQGVVKKRENCLRFSASVEFRTTGELGMGVARFNATPIARNGVINRRGRLAGSSRYGALPNRIGIEAILVSAGRPGTILEFDKRQGVISYHAGLQFPGCVQ